MKVLMLDVIPDNANINKVARECFGEDCSRDLTEIEIKRFVEYYVRAMLKDDTQLRKMMQGFSLQTLGK
jgi:hypothetical protein